MAQLTIDNAEHLEGRNITEVIQNIVKNNPHINSPKNVADIYLMIIRKTNYSPTVGTVDRILRGIRHKHLQL